MPCTPMSSSRRMKAGSKPGVGTLGGHHHRLHVVQVEARMLHVDKGRIKAGKPDDLDDLRIGEAADMGAKGKTALAQNAFDAILPHRWPPVAAGRRRRFTPPARPACVRARR